MKVTTTIFTFFFSIALLRTSGLTIKKNPVLPIILIPGDGGSQLEAKLHKPSVVHYLCEKTTNDYFSLWLNMELLVPVVIDCWIDNMRLIYDNVTRKTSNAEGVDIRVPGFGNSTTVEWIDPSMASAGAYFKDIANTLLPLGYSRNISIRGAPYDFRKAPNENSDYFKDLKTLIEDTYIVNEKQPVLLLAHSMGALMCLHFLHLQSQRWKNRYIRAMITLSGAWGGSLKALKVYTVGDDLGSYVLSESSLKEEQITSPSLAWLLPSALFWHNNEVLVQTDKRNYTVQDYKDFFQDIGYPVAWDMRQDVEKYSLDYRAPGVEVHCLHGYGVQTIDRLVYKPGGFPTAYPSFVYGDGDGTVNKRSLEGCLHWKSQQKPKIYHQTFPDIDHMGILRDIRILEYLKNLLQKL